MQNNKAGYKLQHTMNHKTIHEANIRGNYEHELQHKRVEKPVHAHTKQGTRHRIDKMKHT